MTENIEKDLLQRSAEETEAAAGQENEQAACRQEGQAADREPEQAAGQETESAADRGPEPGAGEQEPSAPVLKKAGFATIIGRPNVGKSTLMNRMIRSTPVRKDRSFFWTLPVSTRAAQSWAPIWSRRQREH